METTNFGKFMRKYRIDHELKLGQIASLLDVSPSFLSAVEKGKKKIPDHWPEAIINVLELDKIDARRLRRSIDQTIGIRKIRAESPEEAELISMIERYKARVSHAKVRRIKEVLKEEEANEGEKDGEKVH